MLKIVLPILATVAIVAPLGWLSQGSRVPGVYSVMEMGYLDYGGRAVPDPGGGRPGGHMQGHMHDDHSEPGRMITDMVADPARPADVRVDLVTQQQTLSVGGRSVSGFTVNGTSPGPEIRATQGDLIEVHLRNDSVADGVTFTGTGLMFPTPWTGWPA
jgi:FtsP/CotA-like multicopper oxidase with cupredoxin domain